MPAPWWVTSPIRLSAPPCYSSMAARRRTTTISAMRLPSLTWTQAGSAGPPYLKVVLGGRLPAPTLAYGQSAQIPGFHVMEAPSDHWVETLTGLAATGVELVLVHTSGRPVQGHRLVPLLQVTSDSSTQQR